MEARSVTRRKNRKRPLHARVVKRDPTETKTKPELKKAAETTVSKRKTKSSESSSLREILSRPFSLVVAGGLLYCLSFPPVGLWPLAWLAPIPWIMLSIRPELDGKKPWRQIWAGSFLFWLVLFYYVRYPHWLLNFGWIALATYLSCYIPMFIGVSRFAIHRWKLDPRIVVPVAWVGAEFLRSVLFGGLALCGLAHSQAKIPVIIQVADIFGGYGLSFLMAAFATGIFLFGKALRNKEAFWFPLGFSGLILAVTVGYGLMRLAEPVDDETRQPTSVALIQGTVDTTFPDTEEEMDRIREDTFAQYERLSSEVLAETKVDLIVWPEGKFTAGPDIILPTDLTGLKAEDRDAMLEHNETVRMLARRVQSYALSRKAADDIEDRSQLPQLLVGCSTWDVETDANYNSAILFGSDSQIEDRYLKVHRVMFGEYIPLGDWFPAIYDLTPLGRGLTPGKEPIAIKVGENSFAPSICFESTVPHLLRRQIRELDSSGTRPDALLNLTDDGWFWGSAALDHHMACNIFRAVELRRPVLVAANTGISAHIDSSGRVLDKGQKRKEGIFVAQVRPAQRQSPYLYIGDWPATACLIFCIAVGLAAAGQRWGNRSKIP